MRSVGLLCLLLVVTPACGGGSPSPPVVEEVGQACLAEVCVRYPDGWEVEAGEGYLNFRHPDHPELLASLSRVDMAALVEAAGGSWPTSTENVVRDFWTLLGQDQPAGLEDLSRTPAGAVRSRGRVGDLVLWHELVPIGAGPQAWALTVRAPNVGWESHARVFLDGIDPDGP